MFKASEISLVALHSGTNINFYDYAFKPLPLYLYKYIPNLGFALLRVIITSNK